MFSAICCVLLVIIVNLLQKLTKFRVSSLFSLILHRIWRTQLGNVRLLNLRKMLLVILTLSISAIYAICFFDQIVLFHNKCQFVNFAGDDIEQLHALTLSFFFFFSLCFLLSSYIQIWFNFLFFHFFFFALRECVWYFGQRAWITTSISMGHFLVTIFEESDFLLLRSLSSWIYWTVIITMEHFMAIYSVQESH